MDHSEEQFQNLIANLVPRVNNVLSQQDKVPPIALLLLGDGDVEVVLSVSDEENNLSEEVNDLQQCLIDKAREKAAVAACLCYPDYANNSVVAFLENDQGYCTKCSIPVVMGQTLQLDLEGIAIEDGMTFVFGQYDP